MPMQGGIGPAGLASEDLHVLDFTDFDRPRWHRCALLLCPQPGFYAADAPPNCMPTGQAHPECRQAHCDAQGDGAGPRPERAVCAHAGAGGQPVPGGAWAATTASRRCRTRGRWTPLTSPTSGGRSPTRATPPRRGARGALSSKRACATVKQPCARLQSYSCWSSMLLSSLLCGMPQDVCDGGGALGRPAAAVRRAGRGGRAAGRRVWPRAAPGRALGVGGGARCAALAWQPEGRQSLTTASNRVMFTSMLCSLGGGRATCIWHLCCASAGMMPTARYQHGAVFVDARLHISGGAVGGGRMVDDAAQVVVLDTAAGMWCTQAPPAPRTSGAMSSRRRRRHAPTARLAARSGRAGVPSASGC